MYSFREQPTTTGEMKVYYVLVGQYWTQIHDDNPMFKQALVSHKVPYSKFRLCKTNPYADGSRRINLMYEMGQAIMGWKRKKSDMGYHGIQCVLFCNKSNIISSRLLVDGQKLARERFEDERYFVYLDPNEENYENIRNSFQKAGWKKVGTSKKNLEILEIIQTD